MSSHQVPGMFEQAPINRDLCLSIHNRDGSVEHYYHYLLGFLVPLTLAHRKLDKGKYGTIYVRSCAIMDKHTRNIEFEKVQFLPKRDLDNLKISSDNPAETIYDFLECWGYDDPHYYSYTDFCIAKSILTELLLDEITKASQALNRSDQEGFPRIVMISRKPPDPFYLSGECEVEGAGKSRRSIPNFEPIFSAIRSQYPNTIRATLEDKSLAYQIALFKSADIIIAQHGAALANLIWCKANTTLIEIHPVNLPQCLQERDYFLNLANCMKINYHRVLQAGKHANVEVESVLSAIQRSLISQQASRQAC
jgi:hypothetical protein